MLALHLAALALASVAGPQTPDWALDSTGLEAFEGTGSAITGYGNRVFSVTGYTAQGLEFGRLECRDTRSGELLWSSNRKGLSRVWGVAHQGDGSSFVLLATEQAEGQSSPHLWLRRFAADTGETTQRVDLGSDTRGYFGLRTASLATDADGTAVFLDRWTIQEVSTYRFQIEGLELRWRSSVDFGTDSYAGRIAVSEDGGLVVTAGVAREQNDYDNDTVWGCFDGETGELRWQHRAFNYGDAIFRDVAISTVPPADPLVPQHPQYRVHVSYADFGLFVDTRGGGAGYPLHEIQLSTSRSLLLDSRRDRLLLHSINDDDIEIYSAATGALVSTYPLEAQRFEIDPVGDRLVALDSFYSDFSKSLDVTTRIGAWNLEDLELLWASTQIGTMGASGSAPFLVPSGTGAAADVGRLVTTKTVGDLLDYRFRVHHASSGELKGAWGQKLQTQTPAPVAAMHAIGQGGAVAAVGISQLEEYSFLDPDVPLTLDDAIRQRVQVLRPEDGSAALTFDLEPSGLPPALAFSPDGERLASARSLPVALAWPLFEGVVVDDYEVLAGGQAWSVQLDSIAARRLRCARTLSNDRVAVLWEAAPKEGVSQYAKRRIGLSLLSGVDGSAEHEALLNWPDPEGSDLAPNLNEVYGPASLGDGDAFLVAARDPSDPARLLIVAIDGADGSTLWSHGEELPALLGVSQATPIDVVCDAAGGRVYVVGGAPGTDPGVFAPVPFLVAYDGATGERLYHTVGMPAQEAAFTSYSPTLGFADASSDGRVFVGFPTGLEGNSQAPLVASFAKASGESLWTRVSLELPSFAANGLAVSPDGAALALYGQGFGPRDEYGRTAVAWHSANDGSPLGAAEGDADDDGRWISAAFDARGLTVGGGRPRTLSEFPSVQQPPQGRVVHFPAPR